MYYVVTGAAGFIGSKIVEALNRAGETDIVAVDNLQQSDKVRNLARLEIADYLDQADFLERLDSFDGPNEAHKGRMASVAFHAYQQLLASGKVKLFVGSGGYGNGEQRRDFVHVDDVVDANLWFLDRRDVSGIFNCGTGRAQTFNELAAAAINSVQGTRHSVKELADKGLIEYIPFPQGLKERYQSFTEADLSRLRGAGYAGEFRTVEQGVAS